MVTAARNALAAAVFDLDGVVTFTARVHFAAWKNLFDEFLHSFAPRHDRPFKPFSIEDYHLYVDGRPRNEGVRLFLESCGISVPYGHQSDDFDSETICGLGNRKNMLFRAKLQQMGVEVDAEAVRLIRELRQSGVHVGVASSSKNTTLVLEHANLNSLFEAQLDGVVSEQFGLRGKPSPDIFLKCLNLLGGTDPSRALVVEDAVAGVQAGRAGGFGLVLGVDRGGNASALRENGADWVIGDFAKVPVRKLLQVYASVFSTRQTRAG